MALAIVLILLALGSVAFHFLNPWHATPVASNWGGIDHTLTLTLVITAIVFVAVNLFVAYTVIRFRHREGAQAAYQPHDKKLELWLIGITSVGIVAMLAPGLRVYSQMIHAPRNVIQVEVLGQQWQWSFRLPGRDGKLGRSDIRFVSAANPFGLDPNDPNAQDDVLIEGGELLLPLGHPIQFLLRSKDVVHDFYVPQFRVKLDMVPGMVSRFWLTPTRSGTFEIACAKYCGLGHYHMSGHVKVVDAVQFQTWLASQPTFAQTQKPAGAAHRASNPSDDLVSKGRALAASHGCAACHSVDGSRLVGPSWKGLYGRTETLSDGSKVVADEKYLKEMILEPNVKIVQGYPPIMPPQKLSNDGVAALIAYIRANSDHAK
ncbi:MAG: cytochrome c oxidase subunit II [Betaproteobacteria bacterium]|nr:cytochrome c oxidase subunit II [Betaproteobacteria bacterium]